MSDPDSQRPQRKTARGLACSQCQDGPVSRLPSNGISPLPTYECLECGTVLTTASGRAIHAFVGLAATAMAAVGVYFIARGEEVPTRGIGLLVTAAIVVIYCFKSVLQPCVQQRLSYSDERNTNEDQSNT